MMLTFISHTQKKGNYVVNIVSKFWTRTDEGVLDLLMLNQFTDWPRVLLASEFITNGIHH